MKLPVIEDGRRIACVLERGLTENSPAVFVSHGGDDGLELIEGQYFDVSVLDMMPRDAMGFSIFEHALRRGSACRYSC